MAEKHNKQPAIQAGDLLAYLEGVADPDVADRIARSPELLAQAAELRTLENVMHTALSSTAAPDIDDLLLYQAGLLDEAERLKVERQLQANPASQDELAQLARADTAPPDSGRPVIPDVIETGKRILTALLQPMAQQPALALRGGEQRQLVYQAGDYQIILAILPPVAGENIWQIDGQILGYVADEQSISVRLLRDAVVVAADDVDEFGFFTFAQLAPASYMLQIELPDEQIVIEEIAIR